MLHLAKLNCGPIVGGAGDPKRALELAAAHAPYLARTSMRRGAVLADISADTLGLSLENCLADLGKAVDCDDSTGAMALMRQAKEAAHLAIAGGDLAGVWDLDRVVGGLTDLADHSVQTGLRLAVRDCWARGRFGEKQDRDDMPGLFALAMGKMGAHELNYSSDVDLILLFDLDLVPVEGGLIKEGMTRMAAELVRVLEERTEDGYVFRTDLRLRPDPGSTAAAVSVQYAHGYYESVGQNWERMAHIKARVCAGDVEAGASYLKELTPYVWRRHLDYWAIADIHSIKRQIHAHGGHASLGARDFDVKLGRGGIREIEFFAQVQQLILGGRRPELRIPATKLALKALAEAGVVERETSDDLCRAYDFLRGLEHRIQMLNDEQTHKLPDAAERRERVAALYGYEDMNVFEADVTAVRKFVHGVYSDLFAEEERLSGAAGNLVFTGVDDDPGTVETLKELGFSDPAKVISTFRSWHRGNIPATRSARAQQLLTSLGPRLLESIAEVGEPDTAFARFSDFFSALPSGVQTMSMLLSEPVLARQLIETMAFAPQLARDLARRPALLDAMLEPRFQRPVSDDEAGARIEALWTMLERGADFEDRLNIARRYHREESFRISYQLLRGQIDSEAAGEAYADLADACVSGLARVAEAEVLGKFEGSIGKWAVCALGKFGGQELSHTSDLDLMLIYDAEETGGGELASRFVQRLVAALSAPTEEGALYEVDMQLRPSGRAGPVAVKFSSFVAYYQGDAWTWEFMALTRLRPVTGDPDLVRRILDARSIALNFKRDAPDLTKDVADMRLRMEKERPGGSRWDLKLCAGGLVDIEFIVQHALLAAGDRFGAARTQSTRHAIAALADTGMLTEEEKLVLEEALTLQLDLQQALRIAAGDTFDPDKSSEGLKSWLAKQAGMADFMTLDEELARLQAEVTRVRKRKLGI